MLKAKLSVSWLTLSFMSLRYFFPRTSNQHMEGYNMSQPASTSPVTTARDFPFFLMHTWLWQYLCFSIKVSFPEKKRMQGDRHKRKGGQSNKSAT